MRNFSSHRMLAGMVCFAFLVTGCTTEFGTKFSEDVDKALIQSGLKKQAGGKALDRAGLRNILPQYDPTQSISTQFPHIAVTIIKSPPMWADSAKGGSDNYYVGCFTLRAVVWDSETQSRPIEPFDWCSPRDMDVTPAVGGMTAAIWSDIPSPYDQEYLTGIKRTEGPRPPITLTPNDRATEILQRKNSSKGSVVKLSADTWSKFGIMFFNLRTAVGAAIDKPDYRLWIVKIEG